MKKIILTGGGTAGHVTPNLALVPRLREMGFEISYIGTYSGMEKELVENAGIPYYGISSGKLRRYFDLKNLTDPFRVIKGYRESLRLMNELKPDIVFSKGGFVSVPVAKAAARKHIPLILHESDMTPGLANRISFSSAVKICCNFPETLDKLPKDKACLTGSPIRAELLTGSREAGLAFTGFTGEKPVLMVTGGSLGAVAVNEAVRKALPALLRDFDVVHLCGKGKTDPDLEGTAGYRQYEYISAEMADLFAMADLVISRAGANAICEIAALCIPNLLIPLSAAASRGDQILNARSFEKQGFSMVLEEEALGEGVLENAVKTLYADRDRYISAMKSAPSSDGVGAITALIGQYTR